MQSSVSVRQPSDQRYFDWLQQVASLVSQLSSSRRPRLADQLLERCCAAVDSSSLDYELACGFRQVRQSVIPFECRPTTPTRKSRKADVNVVNLVSPDRQLLHIKQEVYDDELAVDHGEAFVEINADSEQEASALVAVHDVKLSPGDVTASCSRMQSPQKPTTSTSKFDSSPFKAENTIKKRSTDCFKCDLCGFKAKNAGALGQHKKSHKKSSKANGTAKVQSTAAAKLKNAALKGKTTARDLGRSLEALRQQRQLARVSVVDFDLSQPTEPPKGNDDAAPTTMQCTCCDFSSSVERDFWRHIGHHGRSPAARLQCDKCDFSCDQKAELTDHRKTGHTGSNLLDVSAAPAALPKPSVVKSARKRDASNKKGSALPAAAKANAFFRCDRCPYKCLGYAPMQQHRANHGRVPPLKRTCALCDWSINTLGALTMHMKSAHKQVAKGSSVNARSKAPGEQSLAQPKPEKRVGTSTEMLKCEKCPYRTPYELRLKRHQTSHGHVPPRKHACAYCDWSTDANRGVLTLHVSKVHKAQVQVTQRMIVKCEPVSAVDDDIRQLLSETPAAADEPRTVSPAPLFDWGALAGSGGAALVGKEQLSHRLKLAQQALQLSAQDHRQ